MSIYFWIFVGATIGLLIWGLRYRGRIYEFPFLAGVVFAGFVLPQLIGLVLNAAMLPPNALDRLLLMSTLCAAMCWVGYVAASQKWLGFGWQLDQVRLERAAFVLLAIGLCFHVLLRRLPEEALASSQWSGTPVAYLFIAQLTDYAFFIGLLLFLQTRSPKALVILALSALPYVHAIVYAGRRAATAEVMLGVLVAVWFIRGRAAARWVFVPLAVIAMLMASFSAGDYRSRARDGVALDEVKSIDWRENVAEVLATGGDELPAALYSMDIIAREKLYDYGTYHWNRFVFNYVPAQLLGAGFKQSLYLTWGRSGGMSIEYDYGHKVKLGVTSTGMTDAFGSFGYAGCFKFFLIAWIMAHIYGAARRGDFMAQLMYLMVVVDAMHAVTHNTHWFFGSWPHLALFLLPALLYARVPRGHTPTVIGQHIYPAHR